MKIEEIKTNRKKNKYWNWKLIVETCGMTINRKLKKNNALITKKLLEINKTRG